MNDAAKLRRLIKKMSKCKSTEKLRKMMIETFEIASHNENDETCQKIIKAFSSKFGIADQLVK
jgi:hypothetical protein